MSRRDRAPREGALDLLLGAPLVLLAPVWVPLLRHALADLAAVGGVAPDAAPLAAAAAAWTRRPAAALAFSALLGASLDLTSAAPWGAGCARFVVLTALASRARRAVEDGPGWALLVGLLFAASERGAAALTLGLCQGWPLPPLLLQAGLIALYTAALAPLGFAVARRLPGPGPEDAR
ncbi:MAG: hypothetical protein AB7N76_29190 [Planctomycetota bacterium]